MNPFKRKQIDTSLYYIEVPTRPTASAEKLNKIESISRLDYELNHRYRELEELKSTRNKYKSYGENERVEEIEEEIRYIENKINNIIDSNKKKIKLNKIQSIMCKLFKIDIIDR